LYRVTVDLVVVRACIGCGAIETSQPCLGTCREHRLDLVRADQHAAAQARLSALESRLAQLRTLVSRLARSVPGEQDWGGLRSTARAALRDRVAPVRGEVVTTWSCASCGRVEAPQPCIGVCIRPETAMVNAAEHERLLERAAAVLAQLEALSPPVRQLAWATARAGRFQDTARAVNQAARTAIKHAA
jgi:hypothetical protein